MQHTFSGNVIELSSRYDLPVKVLSASKHWRECHFHQSNSDLQQKRFLVSVLLKF